jgi:hypothetical protein
MHNGRVFCTRWIISTKLGTILERTSHAEQLELLGMATYKNV